MSELTSFEHLKQLQFLDVCFNEFASLMPFSHLPRLRELRVDHNKITDLRGLEQCTSLKHFSIAHNELSGRVDLSRMCWPAIQSLVVSHNRISSLVGLGHLDALQELHAEANELTDISIEHRMPQLRVLRLSDNNDFTELDVGRMPCIRTLYADRCSLASIGALGSAHTLRHLSLRQQSVRVCLPLPAPTQLERLYFAGNAIRSKPVFHAHMPDMVYLELAGCQLDQVSTELQLQTPALRSLNLDHNWLSTIPSLAHWHRLKRLSLVACRISTLECIVQGIRGLSELCVVDTRSNPCTLSLYPPMVLPLHAPDRMNAPPVPHPAIVQPDAAKAVEQQAQTRLRAAQALAERSQFHKRTMLLPPEPAAEAAFIEPEHAMDSARTAALFRAIDERFQCTLPMHVLQKRQVYRGLCGMACAPLTWLDGLEISDADVHRAERQLKLLDR